MYLEFIYGKYYSKQMVDNSKQWFFTIFFFFWIEIKNFKAFRDDVTIADAQEEDCYVHPQTHYKAKAESVQWKKQI